MGINPNSGDGVEKNYTIDGRHDAEGLVSDAEHTGQEAGKAFAHIAAQADSANKGTSELSTKVADHESRIKTLESKNKDTEPELESTSGNGWVVYKRGGMVTMVLTGLEAGFTVPEGYRPPVGIQAPIVRGSGSHDARFGIGALGALKLYGTYTTPVTGIVTYPAA